MWSGQRTTVTHIHELARMFKVALVATQFVCLRYDLFMNCLQNATLTPLSSTVLAYFPLPDFM